jgi:methyl-accepting chemotaxis protein
VALGALISALLELAIIRSVGRVLRTVAGGLSEGSDHVASAANQVSSASQSLAQGTSEQAASLEETGASLEEMASMTQRNAEHARRANELAQQARAAADAGVTDMQTMSAAMGEIKTAGGEIAKIIKIIDEIAFQTNILALNAAVEAARAGEAGMGFGVVAEEVRSLAHRCAQAAKETSAQIEGAITKTNQGVAISAKVAGQLTEMVAKVRQVDELVREVAAASKEQSQGIEQVNQAMGQMDKVTQSNAANAEESASAVEQLNAQALTLKDAVNELMRLVGGEGQASAHAQVPHSRAPSAMNPPEEPAPMPPLPKVALGRSGKGASSRRPAGLPSAGPLPSRSQLPLDGDFKDF